MEDILAVIPAWIMLSLGVILLGLELLLGSFVIIFIGIAFIAIGGIGFFYEWPSGEVQILSTIVLSALLMMTLRKTFLRGMSPEDLPLETMQAGDSGYISEHNGELRVNYKGTTWTIKNTGDDVLQDGDEVVVEQLNNNVAYVKKMNH